MIKPKALAPGDTIGIVAPAGPFDREAFERGAGRLQDLGFQIRYDREIFQADRYMAGKDRFRADQIHRYFSDPEINAIFCARGGYGSLRLIKHLKPRIIRANPKIFVGYSDITTLLLYFQQRCSLVTFHGPMVVSDLGKEEVFLEPQDHLMRLLSSPLPVGALPDDGIKVIRGGQASGPLTGGCLTLIALSIGTPFEIQTQDSILFMEDVGEAPYRIDRLLTYLKLTGKFRGVKGLVFGQMKGCDPDEGSPYKLSAVIADVLRGIRVPILYNVPFGHGESNWAIPLGVQATVDGDRGRLILEEGAVSQVSKAED